MKIVHSSRSSGHPARRAARAGRLRLAAHAADARDPPPDRRRRAHADEADRVPDQHARAAATVDQVALREALVGGRDRRRRARRDRPRAAAGRRPAADRAEPARRAARRLAPRSARARAMADMAVDNLLAALAGRGDAAPRRMTPRRRGRHRHELHAPADRRRRAASSRASRSSPGSARASTARGRLGEDAAAARARRAARASASRSATRAARGGDDLGRPRRRQRRRVRRAACSDALGFAARILSGDEEAQLTFAGATARRGAERVPGDRHRRRLDRARARPRGEVTGTSRPQIGVVRHSERHLHTDPPTAAELDALARRRRDSRRTSRRVARIDDRDRRRRHADPVRGDRPRTGPLRPGADRGPRPHRASAWRELLDRLAALPLAERRADPWPRPRPRTRDRRRDRDPARSSAVLRPRPASRPLSATSSGGSRSQPQREI